MSKIIIRVSGGMVQDVYTDMLEKIDVEILDEDSDLWSGDENELNKKETDNEQYEEEIKLMRAIY